MKLTLRNLAFGLVFATLGAVAVGAAFAQSPGQQLVSPVTVGGAFPYEGGALTQAVKANGGTLTCTAGGTITVTNSNIDANSVVLFGLKTLGGTPAQPYMSAVTAGTSFVVTCGGSDTSVYNYIILG